jgi:hypothetical protein
VWRLYMAASALGFERGLNGVNQVLVQRPGGETHRCGCAPGCRRPLEHSRHGRPSPAPARREHRAGRTTPQVPDPCGIQARASLSASYSVRLTPFLW